MGTVLVDKIAAFAAGRPVQTRKDRQSGLFSWVKVLGFGIIIVPDVGLGRARSTKRHRAGVVP